MRTTTADQEWADQQIDSIEPTRKAVRAFDASESGSRYRAIAGITMYENLGGDTLPPDGAECGE